MERAVKSVTSENQSETGVKNLIDGIEIVLKEMKSLLDKNQIKKIEPLHEKFDYNFHQAMFEAPSSDYEEGLLHNQKMVLQTSLDENYNQIFHEVVLFF